jgi:acyl-CoA thioester hydrolase
MIRLRKRGSNSYFERIPGAPEPIVVEVKRRVRFNEADAMAIVWHGRYPLYFEEASEELGRKCGLSYPEYFEAGLRAPVIELHIDYLRPLFLDEEFTIRAALIWNEGSRLNTEYQLIKQDASIASTAYMVQLFTDEKTGAPLMVSPELLDRVRRKWAAGEFHKKP